ncbi:MAG: hypothetical protein J6L96_02270 [Clostridia bacterium]|nr:hypothetical protein [Clostridia bacterium]
MKTYIFRDCNFMTYDDYEEYDICGEEYKKLISLCCEMCSTLAFAIDKKCEINLVDKLESFRIPAPNNLEYTLNEDERWDIRYYQVCPEIKDLLINSADSIYQWLNGWGFNNPEDPTFYREDGSVFFSSVIHDGELFLNLTEDENVFDTISSNNWELIQSSGNSFEKALSNYYFSIYGGGII